MIAIKSGDYVFDTYKNTRISLRLNNPLFTEDNLSRGSGSFPFDLPSGEESPANAVELGHPDVLENTEGLKKIDAGLFFDGIPFRTGKLVVRGHKGNRTSTNFNFGLGTISDEFKTKKVREIIAQTITIDSGNHPKKVYLKAGALAAAPYTINVNGRTYSNATLAGLATDITNDLTEPRASATYVTTGTTPQGVAQPFIEISAVTNPNDPLTPLHVDYEGDNGNSTTGWVWYIEAMSLANYATAFSDFMDDYNTSPYPSEAIRFPVLFNDEFPGQSALAGFYGGFLTSQKSTSYVNARASAGLLFNVPNYSGNGFVSLNRNSIQPFLRVKWVLDQIADYFGFTYEGDWFDSDVNAMLLDNSVALDVPMDYIGKTKFIFWRRSFNLSELIEDITCVDFLKMLAERYNLSVDRNNATGAVRINKREAVATSTTSNDITTKAGKMEDINDVRLAGVRLVTPKNDTDSYSTADEYVLGEPELTVESRLGCIQQEFTTTIAGAAGSVTGILKQQPFSDKFKMRVFYYKGLINNGTFTYAQALKDALNYTEAWSGATGLYEKRFKYWLYFAMRRRSVKLPVRFEFYDLYKLDWSMRVRVDRNRFLIKSIDAELTPQGVSVSDVELYTMI